MKLNETQKTIVRQLFLNPVVDEGIIAVAPKNVTGRDGRNEEPLSLN